MQRNDKLDVLKMDVGGLVLNVTSRRNVIHKHEDELHINFNFASAIPRDATGLLAELAGVRPMSKATEQMIVKKVDLNSKEKQELKEKEISNDLSPRLLLSRMTLVGSLKFSLKNM